MNLSLNIIPLRITNPSLYAYKATQEDYEFRHAIKIQKKFIKNEVLYPQFKDDILYLSDEGDIQSRITLSCLDIIDYSKMIIAKNLKHYLEKNNSLIIGRGFIDELDIYLKEENYNDKTYDKYNEFRLRILYYEGNFGILISYHGSSYIIKNELIPNNEIMSYVGKFIFNNKVFKSHQFVNDGTYNKIKVISNRNLCKKLGIAPPHFYKNPNKYKTYYSEINRFKNLYLKEAKITYNFEISPNFYIVNESHIEKTPPASNLLEFQKGQTNYNIYNGLKNYGPYEVPKNINRIKFIFIFHKEDKDQVNKYYSYLNRGYKGFPGLERFIGIPFNKESILVDHSIQFSQIDPTEEIKSHFSKKEYSSEVKYFAFYFSRISKTETDPNKFDIYYRVKKVLLENNITSQVIYIDNINESNFSYYLPNIAIGLLAKCGGKPWRLHGSIYDNLVVGVGAFKKSGTIYYGNSICFKNDGTFEEFNSFEANRLDNLGTVIKENIERYLIKNKKVNRLVIHFYKEMNKKEENILLKYLNELQLNIPYVVLTITDSRSNEYIVFDNDFQEKMPVSGTYIKLWEKGFLLCNNARYENKTATKIEDYPLPIRIKISKSRYIELNDGDVIKDLIDQVYQFSRIYWKSIRQKEKPVTIGYSEIIARFSSYFDESKLPEVEIAKNSLWFI